MTLVRHFGWGALALVTLAIIVASALVSPAVPERAIVLERATYSADGGAATAVSLPHAKYPGFVQPPDKAQYALEFELPSVPATGLVLYIPILNRHISVEINGEPLFDVGSTAVWTGPIANISNFVSLPRTVLKPGPNHLKVDMQVGRYGSPTYLSRIYIGDKAELLPLFKWRLLLDEHTKTLSFGVHFSVGIGLVLIFFMRRQDPMFVWLAGLNVVTFFTSVGNFLGYQPTIGLALPYFVAIVPAAGMLIVGTALAVVHLRPPNTLVGATVGVTLTCVCCAFLDTPFTRAISILTALLFWNIGILGGTVILAWGAIKKNNFDARLLLAPFVLWSWFALHDTYITATLPAHPFVLLTPYGRTFFLGMLVAVLMHRMGASLDRVDSANETLALRLAEREAELAVLSRRDRIEATRLTREQERQRLTHDLHDGLSGHLVSIIALSEKMGDKPTEQAAREALNDLRLVIYSLDLGDRELPLALANFRERLVPQLHRLGVVLDWSIASLPEVSGVTPGNALAVLRILQEAITNALKHGPARRIAIRGAVAPGGMLAITVENDGRPFVESNGGHGLANMRRRAHQLHGKLNIEAYDQGTKFTLLLPLCLPDFEDEVSA